MDTLAIILKLIIGLSVLNVWILRSRKESPFRGGKSKTLEEEFEAYGLSMKTLNLVGAVKIILALMLLVSIVYPPLSKPAALGMALMMTAAIFMHLKIKDPIEKSFPALLFLTLSIVLLFI